MHKNQSVALDHVLDVEGGWVNHVFDAGGPTNRGITLRMLAAYLQKPHATVEELQALTEAETHLIYTCLFWNPLRCNELPHGVDLIVFDTAVHAGQGQATRWLQRAINRQHPLAEDLLKEDGVLGSKTVEGAKACSVPDLIRLITSYRILEAFDDPEDTHFARGWVDRALKAMARALSLTQEEA